MYLVATPDKTVWKVTDFDVTPEASIYRVGALSKARGSLPVIQVTQEELNDVKADAANRRAALIADFAKAIVVAKVDTSVVSEAAKQGVSAALASIETTVTVAATPS